MNELQFLNAGVSANFKFEEIKDTSAFEQIMKLNFYACINLTLFALPYIKKSPHRGIIAITSSISGLISPPFRTAYCASKHALHGFFDSLRNEYGDDISFDICMLCPSWVDSGIRDRHLKGDQSQYQVQKKNRIMPLEKCIHIIVLAVANRKRLELFTFRNSFGYFMSVVYPEYTDNLLKQ